jgi:hypothetical protein
MRTRGPSLRRLLGEHDLKRILQKPPDDLARRSLRSNERADVDVGIEDDAAALQLELIAEFPRTAPRFFSSLPLLIFVHGGPPPRLPKGITPAQKRGRAMFDNVPITPGSTRGICAGCHSGPMLDVVGIILTRQDEADIVAFL